MSNTYKRSDGTSFESDLELSPLIDNLSGRLKKNVFYCVSDEEIKALATDTIGDVITKLNAEGTKVVSGSLENHLLTEKGALRNTDYIRKASPAFKAFQDQYDKKTLEEYREQRQSGFNAANPMTPVPVDQNTVDCKDLDKPDDYKSLSLYDDTTGKPDPVHPLGDRPAVPAEPADKVSTPKKSTNLAHIQKKKAESEALSAQQAQAFGVDPKDYCLMMDELDKVNQSELCPENKGALRIYTISKYAARNDGEHRFPGRKMILISALAGVIFGGAIGYSTGHYSTPKVEIAKSQPPSEPTRIQSVIPEPSPSILPIPLPAKEPSVIPSTVSSPITSPVTEPSPIQSPIPSPNPSPSPELELVRIPQPSLSPSPIVTQSVPSPTPSPSTEPSPVPSPDAPKPSPSPSSSIAPSPQSQRQPPFTRPSPSPSPSAQPQDDQDDDDQDAKEQRRLLDKYDF